MGRTCRSRSGRAGQLAQDRVAAGAVVVAAGQDHLRGAVLAGVGDQRGRRAVAVQPGQARRRAGRSGWRSRTAAAPPRRPGCGRATVAAWNSPSTWAASAAARRISCSMPGWGATQARMDGALGAVGGAGRSRGRRPAAGRRARPRCGTRARARAASSSGANSVASASLDLIRRARSRRGGRGRSGADGATSTSSISSARASSVASSRAWPRRAVVTDVDAGVGQPPGGGEPALALGHRGRHVVQADHLGAAGQDGLDVDRRLRPGLAAPTGPPRPRQTARRRTASVPDQAPRPPRPGGADRRTGRCRPGPGPPAGWSRPRGRGPGRRPRRRRRRGPCAARPPRAWRWSRRSRGRSRGRRGWRRGAPSAAARRAGRRARRTGGGDHAVAERRGVGRGGRQHVQVHVGQLGDQPLDELPRSRSMAPPPSRSSRPGGGAATTSCRALIWRTACGITLAGSPSRSRIRASDGLLADPRGDRGPLRRGAEDQHRAARAAAPGQPRRRAAPGREPGPGRQTATSTSCGLALALALAVRGGQRVGDQPQADLAQRGEPGGLELGAPAPPRPGRAGRCCRGRGACAAPRASCPRTGARRRWPAPRRRSWPGGASPVMASTAVGDRAARRPRRRC